MFSCRAAKVGLLSLCLVGCAADATPSTGESAGEIQRGTRELGRTAVASYGTVCTATFVSRARCLVTASHCSGGSLQMGPNVNVGFSDPTLRTTFTRRSLSLRDFTPAPHYTGSGSAPADDIKILWSNASKTPGPNTVDHTRDYAPVPLDFSDASGSDTYTVHGYGFDVCDETGDGILRYGFFRGGGLSNATSGAIAGVRAPNTKTLLRLNGNSGAGICAGDSGSSVRTSAGVRAVIGWSLNGSNAGLATSLTAYRPWFERNVVGAGARFCNPNWPLTVRGGAVDLAVTGGVVARSSSTGGDVDPWSPQAVESANVDGLAAGTTVRVRGADPLAPVRVRITARAPSPSWAADQCLEATPLNPTNAGNPVCTVQLEPTSEESLEVSFTQP